MKGVFLHVHVSTQKMFILPMVITHWNQSMYMIYMYIYIHVYMYVLFPNLRDVWSGH